MIKLCTSGELVLGALQPPSGKIVFVGCVCVVGWLGGWVVGWVVGWLGGWVVGWVVGWSGEWLRGVCVCGFVLA